MFTNKTSRSEWHSGAFLSLQTDPNEKLMLLQDSLWYLGKRNPDSFKNKSIFLRWCPWKLHLPYCYAAISCYNRHDFCKGTNSLPQIQASKMQASCYQAGPRAPWQVGLKMGWLHPAEVNSGQQEGVCSVNKVCSCPDINLKTISQSAVNCADISLLCCWTPNQLDKPALIQKHCIHCSACHIKLISQLVNTCLFTSTWHSSQMDTRRERLGRSRCPFLHTSTPQFSDNYPTGRLTLTKTDHKPPLL